MADDSLTYSESEDKLHDECGVVGVFLNPADEKSKDSPMNAATMSYYGLYSLQHRGQESAGICVSDAVPEYLNPQSISKI